VADIAARIRARACPLGWSEVRRLALSEDEGPVLRAVEGKNIANSLKDGT
jgi:hypothetical protein